MLKVLAVTGYKSFELGIFQKEHKGIHYIKKAIRKRLIPLIEEGLEWVIISGQLGTELWAAEVVIELKKEYPVQLGILTPHLQQEEKWNEGNKEQYEWILSRADFIDSITKRPYENPGQLKVKNQYIVQKTDGLLAFYDDEKKGSPFFMVQEAQKKMNLQDYHIFFITPYDIEEIVNEEQFNDPSNW
ncbi:DUF1273 domain-containing protein [Bacillus pinisoli]|uniref:DUF1273 domain-containing protein n=1 Tax=Bacillus pinisoli TaxID=2901866 RepID=UPI001FF5AFC2|nr:DUF1273 domain-containing protein [Bacillus pinisoli]